MKGIVFTEFLEYVEATLGSDLVDDIIDDGNFAHGGAYTAVGTYDFREMAALVGALSRRTSKPMPDILKDFGHHLCGRFAVHYPAFFEASPSLFDFLDSVNDHIHVEVRKLYPDAELPTFSTHQRSDALLALDYRSCRPLSALAHGLIEGASARFGEPVEVVQEKHGDADGEFVRFSIRHI